MFKVTALSAVDSYKVGHVFQYPKGTTEIYSNLTARTAKHTSAHPFVYDNHVVFVGMQAVAREYLINLWNKTFFHVDKELVIDEYQRRITNLLGFGISMDHISKLWDLGYLPLEIKAVHEGTLVPIGVPMLTIRNTNPDFFWLTNYIETILSAMLWPIITSATNSYYFRKLLQSFADETGMPDWFVQYQGHDFSPRGLFGPDAIAMSGFGALTSFAGTDNLLAIDFAENYYYADSDVSTIGGSVRATEHSVMCLGGKEGQREIVERLIDENPTGILSLVCDGFDYFEMINVILPSLKDKILARDGKLVVRPDSGDPADILCGEKVRKETVPQYIIEDESRFNQWLGECLYETETIETPHGERGADTLIQTILVNGTDYYQVGINIDWNRYDKQYYYTDGWELLGVKNVTPTLEQLGTFKILEKHFGSTVNEKGYKVLNDKIGVIYGDSITPALAFEILTRLKEDGFASQPVFGLGSFFFQYQTRDSFGMAIKATHAIISGEHVIMQKDPATGDGTKKSAAGYIRVHKENGKLSYTDRCDDDSDSELSIRFQDGRLFDHFTLSRIRKKLWGWDDSK